MANMCVECPFLNPEAEFLAEFAAEKFFPCHMAPELKPGLDGESVGGRESVCLAIPCAGAVQWRKKHGIHID